jgi:hypothetical protein
VSAGQFPDSWPESSLNLDARTGLEAVLTRQLFYDGLPKDADDEMYELADGIYEYVCTVLGLTP